MTATDDLRTRMVQAADRLLAASPEHEVSTRAVCEAVGVTQPVLYRLFGDKGGLLDAVADAGFERYAARKAELERTGDPVADLRAGWDDHTAFAREHPALYRLMFAPRPGSGSGAARRVLDLLEATLVRCAAAGALATEPRLAAQLVLPANVGLALNLTARPELFDDPELSTRTREAVLAAVLVPQAAAGGPGGEPGGGHGGEPGPVTAAARRLRSQLALAGTDALEPAESALLERWLERLTAADR